MNASTNCLHSICCKPRICVTHGGAFSLSWYAINLGVGFRWGGTSTNNGGKWNEWTVYISNRYFCISKKQRINVSVCVRQIYLKRINNIEPPLVLALWGVNRFFIFWFCLKQEVMDEMHHHPSCVESVSLLKPSRIKSSDIQIIWSCHLTPFDFQSNRFIWYSSQVESIHFVFKSRRIDSFDIQVRSNRFIWYSGQVESINLIFKSGRID